MDLRELRPDLPKYSPRLVQEALYAFCSKSNRLASGDPCGTSQRDRPCEACAPSLCPFVDGRQPMSPSRSKPAFEPPDDETGRAVNQAPALSPRSQRQRAENAPRPPST